HSCRTRHPPQITLARTICCSPKPTDEMGKKRSGSADRQAPADRQFAAFPVAVIACPRRGLSKCHVRGIHRPFPLANRLHLRTAGISGGLRSDRSRIAFGWTTSPRTLKCDEHHITLRLFTLGRAHPTRP